MNKLKHAIILFAILLVIWLLLVPWNLQEVIAGLILSAVIVLLTQQLEPVLSAFKLTPRSVINSFIYSYVFLKELVISNLDVAKRVLSPSLPINPGFVVVTTQLQSDIGKLVLANSITLTPGTLTTEVRGQNLYIHWIDVTEENIEGATEEIVKKFEKYLEVIFG